MGMPPGPYPGEQQQTEGWRIALAIGLVMFVIFLWPYIFPQAAPPESPSPEPQVAGEPAAPGDASADAAAPALAPELAAAASQPATAPAVLPRPDESFVAFESPLIQARISSWGAALVDFKLTAFRDEVKRKKGQKAPLVDLIPGKGPADRSFSVRTLSGTFSLPPDAAYEVVEQAENVIGLRHDTGQGVVVTRRFTFDPKSYAFDVETSFENTSGAVQSATLKMAVSGREREGEREEGGFFQPPTDQMGWVCRTDQVHQALSQKHEQDETLQGSVRWAGISRHYFLAAMVPREVQAVACSATRTRDFGLRVGMELAPLTIPAGQSVRVLTTGFFGPKQLDHLKQLQAGVDEAIDFGWFGAIARPLLWLLVLFYGYVNNYGVAIMLLTLLVKLVLLPVTQKSFESAERMKKIQPLLKELQEKYKGDRMMASQKQMELFKQHNVSPFGGCLPMALQMPIWIALYRTLYSSVELYQQPFIAGWIDNLAFKDPYYVLPLAVGVVMLVQQFFTPMPQDNPSMKYVMWGMPIMFTFVMFSLPSGLALYIFINSVLTIFQQVYIRRKLAGGGAAK